MRTIRRRGGLSSSWWVRLCLLALIGVGSLVVDAAVSISSINGQSLQTNPVINFVVKRDGSTTTTTTATVAVSWSLVFSSAPSGTISLVLGTDSSCATKVGSPSTFSSSGTGSVNVPLFPSQSSYTLCAAESGSAYSAVTGPTPAIQVTAIDLVLRSRAQYAAEPSALSLLYGVDNGVFLTGSYLSSNVKLGLSASSSSSSCTPLTAPTVSVGDAGTAGFASAVISAADTRSTAAVYLCAHTLQHAIALTPIRVLASSTPNGTATFLGAPFISNLVDARGGESLKSFLSSNLQSNLSYAFCQLGGSAIPTTATLRWTSDLASVVVSATSTPSSSATAVPLTALTVDICVVLGTAQMLLAKGVRILPALSWPNASVQLYGHPKQNVSLSTPSAAQLGVVATDAFPLALTNYSLTVDIVHASLSCGGRFVSSNPLVSHVLNPATLSRGLSLSFLLPTLLANQSISVSKLCAALVPLPRSDAVPKPPTGSPAPPVAFTLELTTILWTGLTIDSMGLPVADPLLEGGAAVQTSYLLPQLSTVPFATSTANSTAQAEALTVLSAAASGNASSTFTARLVGVAGDCTSTTANPLVMADVPLASGLFAKLSSLSINPATQFQTIGGSYPSYAVCLTTIMGAQSTPLVDTGLRFAVVQLDYLDGIPVSATAQAQSLRNTSSNSPVYLGTSASALSKRLVSTFSTVSRQIPVVGSALTGGSSWTVLLFDSASANCKTDTPQQTWSLTLQSAGSGTLAASAISSVTTYRKGCVTFNFRNSSSSVQVVDLPVIYAVQEVRGLLPLRSDGVQQAAIVGLRGLVRKETIAFLNPSSTSTSLDLYVGTTSSCLTKLTMSGGVAGEVLQLIGSSLAINLTYTAAGRYTLCASSPASGVNGSTGISFVVAEAFFASLSVGTFASPTNTLIGAVVNEPFNLPVTGSFLSSVRLYLALTDLSCSDPLVGETTIGIPRDPAAVAQCGSTGGSATFSAPTQRSSSNLKLCYMIASAADPEPAVSSLTARPLELSVAVSTPSQLTIVKPISSQPLSSGEFTVQPRIALIDSSTGAIAGTLPPNVILRAHWYSVSPIALDIGETFEMTSKVGDSSFDFALAPTPIRLRNFKFGYQYVLEFSLVGTTSILPVNSSTISPPFCADRGQYAKLYTSQCADCPPELQCDGTPNMLIKPGQSLWRPNNQSTKTYSCSFPYMQDTCLANTSTGTCLPGHTGPRCSVCLPGYGTALDYCNVCPSKAESGATVFGILLALLAGIVIIVSSTMKCAKADHFPTFLKITVNHFVVISLIGQFYQHLPRRATDLLSFQRTASRPSPHFSALNCATGWDWYDVFIMVNLLPVILSVGIGLIITITKTIIKDDKEEGEEEGVEGEAGTVEGTVEGQPVKGAEIVDLSNTAEAGASETAKKNTKKPVPKKGKQGWGPKKGAAQKNPLDPPKKQTSLGDDDDDDDLQLDQTMNDGTASEGNASDGDRSEAGSPVTQSETVFQTTEDSPERHRHGSSTTTAAPPTEPGEINNLSVRSSSLKGDDAAAHGTEDATQVEPIRSSSRTASRHGSATSSRGDHTEKSKSTKTGETEASHGSTVPANLQVPESDVTGIEEVDATAAPDTGDSAEASKTERATTPKESDDPAALDAGSGAEKDHSKKGNSPDPHHSGNESEHHTDANGEHHDHNNHSSSSLNHSQKTKKSRTPGVSIIGEEPDGEQHKKKKPHEGSVEGQAEGEEDDESQKPVIMKRSGSVDVLALTSVEVDTFDVSKQSKLHVFTVTVIVVLFLLYPTIVEICAEAWKCDPFDESQLLPDGTPTGGVVDYFFFDRSIRCNDKNHRRYQIAAAVLGLFWAVATPLFALALFARLRRPQEKGGVGKANASRLFTFLVAGYRKDVWWWEGSIMLRKSAIIVILDFLASPQMQTLAATWVITASLILHVLVSPFDNGPADLLERLSLGSISFALNLGVLLDLMYGYDVLSRNSQEGEGLGWLVFAVNLTVTVILVLRTLVELIQKLRKDLHEGRGWFQKRAPKLMGCIRVLELKPRVRLLYDSKGRAIKASELTPEEREYLGIDLYEEEPEDWSDTDSNATTDEEPEPETEPEAEGQGAGGAVGGASDGSKSTLQKRRRIDVTQLTTYNPLVVRSVGGDIGETIAAQEKMLKSAEERLATIAQERDALKKEDEKKKQKIDLFLQYSKAAKQEDMEMLNVLVKTNTEEAVKRKKQILERLAQLEVELNAVDGIQVQKKEVKVTARVIRKGRSSLNAISGVNSMKKNRSSSSIR